MNKGFLTVASKNKFYLSATQLLADSIKEYSSYPITLVTEDRWVNDLGNRIFDNVVGGAPNDIRAKLWGLTKTPYDITCFLDADMICLSNEADNVFDSLMDNDIVFTKIRTYNAAKVWWNVNEEYRPHGGSFVWNNNNRMKTFMSEWWNNWQWKSNNQWHERWTDKYDPKNVNGWDQFPLHLMLFDKDDPWYRDDIKWNWYFDTNKNDDAKWNFIQGYDEKLEGFTRDEIIFYSYPRW